MKYPNLKFNGGLDNLGNILSKRDRSGPFY